MCFMMNAEAPRLKADWTTLGSSTPESTMQVTFGWRFFKSSRQASPSIPGIRKSSKTVSAWVLPTSGSTSAPLDAVPTTSKSGTSSNAIRIASSIKRWSSTMSTLCRRMSVPHFRRAAVKASQSPGLTMFEGSRTANP